MEWFDNFWAVYSNVVLTIGTNSLLALSIWLTLACGMLAMANAAFMSIGAYTAALLTMNFELPFPLALAGGMAAPMAVAFVIGKPTLRLSGVYLAMATLGFGEVVRVIVLNAESVTGGALGLNGIPQLTEWWHVALAVVLTLAVLARLRRSKVGRAFEAIKEDETAAGLMGVDVNSTKMLAFVLGAMLAGLAGALNAHLTFFIGPGEYGFDRGVEILTMAILGGISSLAGPVVGAAILTVLPEVLRAVTDFRSVVTGLILVGIVLFLPKGIWDPARFRWGKPTPSRPLAAPPRGGDAGRPAEPDRRHPGSGEAV
ncbi:branched-chain amino acid ABC transporter permease [Pigmentiphaga soli]|uniref:Branched-chain amino acid ABC transporter permease n=1 Tax=Pigmentiphaga soli TaxID=1007095 RepID=A0ABP8H748_9BURK